MATVLLIWEAGGGMGHLSTLRPIGFEMARRGHRVLAALRDVIRGAAFFRASPVQVFPAPLMPLPGRPPIDPPRCYSHVLHNSGFGDLLALSAICASWKTLFTLVGPDLIVLDHAPRALLAARGIPSRLALVGSGFVCPPGTRPMPSLYPDRPVDPDAALQHESDLLRGINQLLAEQNAPALPHLGELYGQAHAQFLCTFPELDHFPRPAPARYCGVWPHDFGSPPQWPAGSGSRIFAYLKPFAALPPLLDALRRSSLPTLVVGDGLEPDLVRKFESATLRFSSQPVELRRAATECDLAITNAGHNATTAMLLAGKPLLLVPLYTEQYLFARRITAIGAGLCVAPENGAGLVSALQQLLATVSFRHRAADFSQKNHRFDPTYEIHTMCNDLERLLT